MRRRPVSEARIAQSPDTTPACFSVRLSNKRIHGRLSKRALPYGSAITQHVNSVCRENTRVNKKVSFAGFLPSRYYLMPFRDDTIYILNNSTQCLLQSSWVIKCTMMATAAFKSSWDEKKFKNSSKTVVREHPTMTVHVNNGWRHWTCQRKYWKESASNCRWNRWNTKIYLLERIKNECWRTSDTFSDDQVNDSTHDSCSQIGRKFSNKSFSNPLQKYESYRNVFEIKRWFFPPKFVILILLMILRNSLFD